MIIFDLDGVLAHCEHRRHFVDASKRSDCYFHSPATLKQAEGWYYLDDITFPKSRVKFEPDWRSFYEACDKDKPIREVVNVFRQLALGWKTKIMIWSGRCESVRQKTQDWLFYSGIGAFNNESLKMRPIGDTTPDDQLKENWLDDLYEPTKWGSRHPIEFVFDSDPKSIAMWRRYGIFVFNCCQHDGEF